MAYLGNTPTTQGFIPAIDFFSGNGATVAFTLSRPVASVAQVQATIENVPQNPGDAFTVSGNTITFTSAPPSGTNNIYVYYTSPITQVIQPGQGTVGLSQLTASGSPSSSTFLRGDNSWQVVSVTPTAVSDQLNASTGYFDLPAGTTAQRPSSGLVNGMARYNTTLNQFEVYQNGNWTQYVTLYNIDYLIVAGGGGGGSPYGGGGGAGGYIASSGSATSGGVYPITIGGGGNGGSPNNVGSNGSASSFFSQTASGGGGGGEDDTTGVSGGSGGGGADGSSGGSATSGQGNAGGTASDGYGGAGGGGAGAAGSSSANLGGNKGGGAGLNWQSLGTFYAGGGGGAFRSDGGQGTQPGGAGGAGGGGAGSTSTSGSGTAGSTNTGGGGGGSGTGTTGANGGSGIVILRYAGAQRGTGGTITSAGGFTYHTFTSSGTYTA